MSMWSVASIHGGAAAPSDSILVVVEEATDATQSYRCQVVAGSSENDGSSAGNNGAFQMFGYGVGFNRVGKAGDSAGAFGGGLAKETKAYRLPRGQLHNKERAGILQAIGDEEKVVIRLGSEVGAAVPKLLDYLCAADGGAAAAEATGGGDAELVATLALASQLEAAPLAAAAVERARAALEALPASVRDTPAEGLACTARLACPLVVLAAECGQCAHLKGPAVQSLAAALAGVPGVSARCALPSAAGPAPGSGMYSAGDMPVAYALGVAMGSLPAEEVAGVLMGARDKHRVAGDQLWLAALGYLDAVSPGKAAAASEAKPLVPWTLGVSRPRNAGAVPAEGERRVPRRALTAAEFECLALDGLRWPEGAAPGYSVPPREALRMLAAASATADADARAEPRTPGGPNPSAPQGVRRVVGLCMDLLAGQAGSVRWADVPASLPLHVLAAWLQRDDLAVQSEDDVLALVADIAQSPAAAARGNAALRPLWEAVRFAWVSTPAAVDVLRRGPLSLPPALVAEGQLARAAWAEGGEDALMSLYGRGTPTPKTPGGEGSSPGAPPGALPRRHNPLPRSARAAESALWGGRAAAAARLAEAEASAAAAVGDYASLKDKWAGLQQDLIAADDELDKAKAKADATERDFQALRGECDKLKAAAAATAGKGGADPAEVAELKQDLSALQDNYSDILKELTAAEEERDKLKAAGGGGSKEVAEPKKVSRAAKHEAAAALLKAGAGHNDHSKGGADPAEVAELKKDLSALQDNYSDILKELTAAEEERDKLKAAGGGGSKGGADPAEVAELKEEVKDLEEQVAEADKDYSALKGQLSDLQQKLLKAEDERDAARGGGGGGGSKGGADPKEVAELKKDLSALQDNYSDILKELTAAEEERDKLKAAGGGGGVSKGGADPAEVAELKKDLSALQDNYSDILKELTAAEEERDKLKAAGGGGSKGGADPAEVAELKEEVKDLEEQVAEADKDYSALKGQLSDLQQKLLKAEDERDAARGGGGGGGSKGGADPKEVAELKKDLSALQDNYSDILKKLTAAEEERDKLKAAGGGGGVSKGGADPAEVAELKKDLSALQDNYSDILKELTAAEEERDKLKAAGGGGSKGGADPAEVAELKEEVKDLEEQVAEADKDYSALKGQLSDLQQKLLKAEDERDAARGGGGGGGSAGAGNAKELQSKLARVEAELSTVIFQRGEAEKALKASDDRCTALKECVRLQAGSGDGGDAAELKQDLSALRDNYSDILKELTAAEAERDTLKEQRGHAERALKSAEDRCSQLQGVKEKCNSLEKELSAAKAAPSGDGKGGADPKEVAELKQDLSALQDNYSDILKELTAAETERDELKKSGGGGKGGADPAEVAELKEEVKDLEEQVAEADKDYSALKGQLSDLQQKLLKAEDERDAAREAATRGDDPAESAELKQDLRALQDNYSDILKELTAAEEERDKLKAAGGGGSKGGADPAEVAELKEEVKDLEEQVAEADKDYSALKGQLSDLQQKLLKAEDERDAARGGGGGGGSKGGADPKEVAELKKDLSALRDNYSDILKELTAAEEERDKLKAAGGGGSKGGADPAAAEVAELKEAAESRADEVRGLREEIARLSDAAKGTVSRQVVELLQSQVEAEKKKYDTSKMAAALAVEEKTRDLNKQLADTHARLQVAEMQHVEEKHKREHLEKVRAAKEEDLEKARAAVREEAKARALAVEQLEEERARGEEAQEAASRTQTTFRLMMTKAGQLEHDIKGHEMRAKDLEEEMQKMVQEHESQVAKMLNMTTKTSRDDRMAKRSLESSLDEAQSELASARAALGALEAEREAARAEHEDQLEMVKEQYRKLLDKGLREIHRMSPAPSPQRAAHAPPKDPESDSESEASESTAGASSASASPAPAAKGSRAARHEVAAAFLRAGNSGDGDEDDDDDDDEV